MKSIIPNDAVVIHDACQRSWLLFRYPRSVYSVNSISEIIPAIAAVEEEVMHQGAYAAGFISYEAAPAFDPSLVTREHDAFPLLWFGIFDRPESISFPVISDFSPDESLIWTPSVTRKQYRDAIDTIKGYIASGDTYQVNYTFRMTAPFTKDPWDWFRVLVRAQNTPFGAFVNTDCWAVCSASPELFFTREGDRVISRPMKGTAPRGLMLSDDTAMAEWLFHSEKNRAENVMIVDMVRNDIGRIAKTGSVEVSDLFAIEKYPTIWQMTSTVSAQSTAGFGDILCALFPPASITGAPKSRTMEIIAELETTPRRVYTGMVGFLSPGGNSQFNVAIRTVLIDKTKKLAEYGVGGGIVWDSDDSQEYEECRTKAKILTRQVPDFELLETLRWTPGEDYFLLEYHMKRLMDSAAYFSFAVDPESVRDHLASLVPSFSGIPHRVRLTVADDGRITCQHRPLELPRTTRLYRVCLAKSPVDSSNPFLYHKTTNRSVYEEALAACPGYDDVILFNERGEITESCIANVVVERDGERWTPPVRCGLLPGTYRAFLIEQGMVKERVISKEDLTRNPHVSLINSVRKEWKITFAREGS
ncbi:aminodeoxychorismate synthase component I [Candidatus Latescibacterota bacterium]